MSFMRFKLGIACLFFDLVSFPILYRQFLISFTELPERDYQLHLQILLLWLQMKMNLALIEY